MIGMCDSGICDIILLEYNSVGHSLCIFFNSADMCSVVVWGGLEVPSIDSMDVPESAHAEYFVD